MSMEAGMAERKYLESILAAACCAFAMAAASIAADHAEAPLILPGSGSSTGNPANTGAENPKTPQEHSAIKAWRERDFPTKRPPILRPPRPTNLTPGPF
jgi:hypothetical protein